MDSSKPSKESVREYMDRRTHEESPPPTLEEIRRELGWDLIRDDRSREGDKET